VNPAALQRPPAPFRCWPTRFGAVATHGVGAGVDRGVGLGVGLGVGRGVGSVFGTAVGPRVGVGPTGSARAAPGLTPRGLGPAVRAGPSVAPGEPAPDALDPSEEAVGPANPKPPSPAAPGVPVTPATPPAGPSGTPNPNTNANAVAATTKAAPATANAGRRLRAGRVASVEALAPGGMTPMTPSRRCSDGKDRCSGMATIETPQAGHHPTDLAQQRWQA